MGEGNCQGFPLLKVAVDSGSRGGEDCRSFGSVMGCSSVLMVYGESSPDMFFLCFHGSVQRHVDMQGIQR